MGIYARAAFVPVILAMASGSGCKIEPSEGRFGDASASSDDGASEGGSGGTSVASGAGSDGDGGGGTQATHAGDDGSDGAVTSADESGSPGSGATPAMCGNGMAEGTEECDQNDFGFRTCQTYGFLAGSLTCKDDCSVDPSSCSSEAICGDLAVAGLEQCEGEDLAGASCDSLGLGSGELGCTDTCTFDAAGCSCAGKGEGCMWNPGIPGVVTGCCPAGYKGNEHGACTMYYVCI